MKKTIWTEKYRRVIDWLIDARKEAGLTQQQLADALGRPQSFVAKYENMERRLDIVEFVEIALIADADPKKALELIN
ncbi:MAG: helix-turn-helix transcriptional regulator [Alphaproteobacteria bacterium]